MNQLRKGALCALAWLLVIACEQSEAGPSPESMAADEAAINAVRESEMAALNSGDVEASLRVYSADIDMMAPGNPAVSGAASLRTFIEGMQSAFSVNADYTSSEIELVGDVAIERYDATITMTPRAGGAAISEVIKGLHVYRRQADGSWRIAQDIWNSDAPPPAAPAATPAP